MKKVRVVTVVVAIVMGTTCVFSQEWSVGGKMGLSLLDGSAGAHIAPLVELRLNRQMSVGTEFSVNTQYGTPLIFHAYVKYYFDLRGSELRPYAGAGPLLAINVPNGPCFGFLLSGGVDIRLADRLHLVPGMVLGPVFEYGGGTYPYILSGYYWGYQTYGLTSYTVPSSTILAFSLRGGIRYEI